MKKYLMTTAVVFIGFLQGFTQIVLQSSDMPSTGDTVRLSVALSTQNFDFTATGENFSWDFSGLQAVSQRLDTFKSVTQTPTVFWLSFLTSANLALRIGSGELMPGLVLDDAYQFYNKSSTAYKDMGFGIILSGIPIPLKFSSPDVVYTFPYNAGQSHTSDALLEYTLPGMGFLSIQRNRQTVADGWGNLTTPYGSFEVLRLKSIVYERDSVYIDTAAQGMMIERNYTEYKWMAKNKKVPVLQYTDDQLLGSIVFYQDSLRDLTVGISEKEKIVSAIVFPNPVTGSARVTISDFEEGEIVMKLINHLGVIVAESALIIRDNAGVIDLPFHPSDFKPGIYVLEIVQKQKRASSRIIFSHP